MPTHQAGYFINCDGPISATDADNYSKVGKSSAKSILSLFAWGDASIQSAMDDAECKIIHHVDYNQVYIVLPIVDIPVYSEFTTLVYGE